MPPWTTADASNPLPDLHRKHQSSEPTNLTDANLLPVPSTHSTSMRHRIFPPPPDLVATGTGPIAKVWGCLGALCESSGVRQRPLPAVLSSSVPDAAHPNATLPRDVALYTSSSQPSAGRLPQSPENGSASVPKMPSSSPTVPIPSRATPLPSSLFVHQTSIPDRHLSRRATTDDAAGWVQARAGLWLRLGLDTSC